MESQRGTIRVAAGQITARLMNEADATLASIEQAITEAAARHAELLVLPECAYPPTCSARSFPTAKATT